MEVKAMIDRLVASGKFTDEHRDWLMALGEGPLTVISASCGVVETESTPSTQPAEPAPAEPAKEPVAAAAPKPMTEAEMLAQLPPERREMYAEAFAEWDAENQRLCAEIEKHRPGVFTTDELKAKSRKELKQIHALAAPPAPDFSGQGLRAADGTARAAKVTHATMPALPIKRRA